MTQHIPTSELNVSVRVYNALRRNWIDNTEELYEWGENRLQAIPNLGAKGMRDLKDALRLADLPRLPKEAPRYCPHCGGQLPAN